GDRGCRERDPGRRQEGQPSGGAGAVPRRSVSEARERAYQLPRREDGSEVRPRPLRGTVEGNRTDGRGTAHGIRSDSEGDRVTMATATLGRLQIRTHGTPPVVTLIGGSAVGPDFWLRLRAEFGSAALVKGDRLQVSADVFLAYRKLLRILCEQYRVPLEMDQATRDLLTAIRREEDTLKAILRGIQPLTEEQARERLRGSRYARELRPFQWRDLGRLLALPHGANFSVPGAGKTAVAYATYEAERH